MVQVCYSPHRRGNACWRIDAIPSLLLLFVPCLAVRGDCSPETGVCGFRAVPFAEPPIGNRRFAPPVPLIKHSSNSPVSVMDATKQGPACFQTPHDPTTPQAEDCLHLNVWTHVLPKDTSEPKPVIVFFYGMQISRAFHTAEPSLPLCLHRTVPRGCVCLCRRKCSAGLQRLVPALGQTRG